jgi:hydroxyethylthiazole kinase-like uncharacterized protein yjeF
MPKDPERDLPAEIYTVANVRRIDSAAIDDAGISAYALMTRAAQAALDHAMERFPDARRWQIVCGGGNNGGDGYVLARLASNHGIAVSVITLVSPESLDGVAKSALEDFAAEGGGLVAWEGELDIEAELIIDGLLGSGLTREVTGDFAAAVAAIDKHDAPVLSLDIPTGINGDTGEVMGVAVRANMTVTFVGLKGGLFLDEGPDHVGELRFAGLDIPSEFRSAIAADMRRITGAILSHNIPIRKRSAHKGDFGHVLVIGGGPGMPGAARLAGEAALRSGAGRVTIATHGSHLASVTAGRPELMCHAVESIDDIDPLITDSTIIVLGPGLGQSEWSVSLFEGLVNRPLSLVLDADALNLLADADHSSDDWILTPHPGEAARLLGTTTDDVQSDRVAALNKLVSQYGGSVVLKGAGSLISSANGPPWLCTAGNPGMAAPGMGDVLTGIIAALWAQGFGRKRVALLGTEIHARAGDTAAESGERGMLASDLMMELRAWVNP